MPIEQTFLSYSHKQKGLALSLRDLMKAVGYAVHMDLDVPHGGSIPSHLAAKITSCSTLLLLDSPESRVSDHVQAEVELALGQGKRVLVLPVGIDLDPKGANEMLRALKWLEPIERLDPNTGVALLQALSHGAAGRNPLEQAFRSKSGERNRRGIDLNRDWPAVLLCLILAVWFSHRPGARKGSLAAEQPHLLPYGVVIEYLEFKLEAPPVDSRTEIHRTLEDAFRSVLKE